jgi:cephalosporin hydroxylase
MDWNLSLYGMIGQQHRNFLSVFEKFFSQVKPTNIVEIGTGHGGAAMALYNDVLKKLNYQFSYTTYDIINLGQYQQLRDSGINVRCCNLFSDDYGSIRASNYEEIKNAIQSPGTTVLMCDGGNKINEVNLLADLLKPGDFIMAHDYSESKEYFEKYITPNEWLWCEITFADVKEALDRNKCEPYMQDEFQSVVWMCRRKPL